MAGKQKAGDRIRVAELFAGVGGFRLGLQRASGRKSGFEIVFSDQWEPGRKTQHASNVYVARFGAKGHLNADISMVDVKDIPDHDMLVGGFPCQDYSVASTLRSSKGLVGKKGVLWWQIHRILQDKQKKRPKYLFLENVDRLLGSPVGQRGRDLAVMLRSLDELGYAVEWRVINAADYGMPQRRRRVFILGYLKGTRPYEALRIDTPIGWMTKNGTIAKAFPCIPLDKAAGHFSIARSLEDLSKNFGEQKGVTPFRNCGVMIDGVVFTMKVEPKGEGEVATLRSVLQEEASVPASFHITHADLPQWKYLKGAKQEPRTSAATGHQYAYAEGAMTFPDALDRPSRTIITGEGGRSPSRFKHIILVNGRYRRLTPLELERLNMFPDGHTEGASDNARAFFMGNALVVGVVERIGKALLKAIATK
ncbi:MAG: DNA (cytosine-5-)-methyltransferase [Flavobacteriales bacterium]|nr:DNA (cytosine-5-)-methyltransferase [Flavobacteriales bacterium]MCC6937167.1 DNA (cytosine-5-)-methyltransferase [Flavobacteriales bacterium]